MTQYLIIKSALRGKCQDNQVNMGSQFFEEVNKEMDRIVQNAIKRAGLNGRKTVYGKDV